MLRILVISFAVFISFKTNCQDIEPLIGRTIQPFDEPTELSDFKKIGSALIQDEFAIVHYRDNLRQVILFEEIIRDSDELFYKILDALKITTNDKTDYMSYQLCRSNGEQDDRIIAWVKLEDKEYFNAVTKAWIVNMSTLKFEPIDTNGIDCMNEGWGTGH